MIRRLCVISALVAGSYLGIAALPLRAEAPLSIIDWLEIGDVIATPSDPPVTETAIQPRIDVQPLDARQTPVGLVPPSVTGLPVDLWENSDPAQIVRQLRTLSVTDHPALQSLLYSLLLTEAVAPKGDTTLIEARIDTLLELGAIDPAKALIEVAGPTSTPALFERWVDMSFLTGNEDDVCQVLESAPYLSPNRETLIFCAARRGDLNRATLLFDANQALGDLDPAVAPVLDRFLHPELFENPAPLPQPRNPSPLTFRLFEAIGERLPTTALPRKFAVADLRDVAGWKAQLEAAERLARTGAISSNTLLGLYTERLPAASGGVWDRVAALQRFETALDTGSADAVTKTLPRAWTQMARVTLIAPFADLFGARLAEIELPPSLARTRAVEMALLSSDYERLTRDIPPQSETEAFWVAVAQGTPAGTKAPNALSQAIADGFAAAPEVPPDMDASQLGETILQAMALFDRGADGNYGDLTKAITVVRALGLADVARRASLHLMIMEDG